MPISFFRRNYRISTTQLPEDIIGLILARLPVKSLLKFRCVSKSWHSLISSNHFVKTQLEISKKNTNFTNHTIFISNFIHPLALFPVLKQFWLFKPSYEFASQTFPCSNVAVVLVGSCNGLCCSLLIRSDGREFLLWNPSTRKSTKFPIVDNIHAFNYLLWGFCYDESVNEYKVLQGLGDGENGCITHLFGLKSNSRKIVKQTYPYKGRSSLGSHGTFVNRRFHWLMKHSDVNSNELDIICFDMATEMYGEVVEQPVFLDSRLFPEMGVLGECLSVVSDDMLFSTKEIWVMRNYGVKESWEKVMSIPCSMNSISLLERLRPLCITPAGEIVFCTKDNLVYIYDPKLDIFPRDLDIPRYSQLNDFTHLDYCVQTLISPLLDDVPIQ